MWLNCAVARILWEAFLAHLPVSVTDMSIRQLGHLMNRNSVYKEGLNIFVWPVPPQTSLTEPGGKRRSMLRKGKQVSAFKTQGHLSQVPCHVCGRFGASDLPGFRWKDFNFRGLVTCVISEA